VSQAIDFEALGAARFNAEPYPWAQYTGAFADAQRLADTFPDDSYEPHAQQRLLETLGRRASAEWYQHNVFTRALLELGETRPFRPEGLDDAWLAVARDLASAEYRERLTELTGYDVRSIPMQAHFWKYQEGSFFKPHVDKPHKIVTHLMFLTDGWEPAMGGCFQVLGSGRQDDVRAEISPELNNAIVLRRTDNAWHSVSAIPRDQRTRKVLQTWFWA
jgi:hypothetical protein